jgi:hypothetical protein
MAVCPWSVLHGLIRYMLLYFMFTLGHSLCHMLFHFSSSC